MKRLDVIPKPNKVEFLGGEVDPSELEITYIEDKSLADEAYVLTVVKSGTELRYGSPSGKFYGEQTLAQLGESCPRVRIEDRPAYKYRGFMLDTVRHIFTVEQTKKIIDAAAEVKMNRMHWHLTDDQGFRLTLDSHPEITEKASVRPDSAFGSLDEHGEYGGCFTKDELREIVDYCAERFITVIPEFDVPGHCSALLHACPQLSCSGGEVEVKTHQAFLRISSAPARMRPCRSCLTFSQKSLISSPPNISISAATKRPRSIGRAAPIAKGASKRIHSKTRRSCRLVHKSDR